MRARKMVQSNLGSQSGFELSGVDQLDYLHQIVRGSEENK